MKLLSTHFSLAKLSWFAAAIALVLSVTVAEARAAFPGTPGQIVYSKEVSNEESNSGGLVTHSPRRQGGSHPVTSDIGDDAPSYSADGRTIVFSGNREPPKLGSSFHIYLMNADGSGVRALTSGESFDRNPSFSPNGQQVVFDRTTPPSQPQIFIVNVDGTGLRQLTEGPSENYDPVFAPSGKWLAFVSNRDHDVKTDRTDIFSMRPDGSRQKVLIDGPRNESEPDISPNGRKVAFVSNRVSPGLHIYVAKSNGRRVRALTHGSESCHYTACYFSPAWAPDGKHIALLSVRRYSTDLEVMRSDGTERKEFTTGGTEAEGYGTRIGAPTWGPR